MRRIYNYNTGKLYESDGTYVVSVTEKSLNPDVDVNPGDEQVEFDEKYMSEQDAIDAIDDAVDQLADNEGFERESAEIVDDKKGGFIVTVPDFKEWHFTLTNVLPECSESANLTEEQHGESNWHLFDLLKDINDYYDCVARYLEERERMDHGVAPDSYENMMAKKYFDAIAKVKEYVEYLDNAKIERDDFHADASERLGDVLVTLSKCRMMGTKFDECARAIRKLAGDAIFRLHGDKNEACESVTTKFSKLRSLFEEHNLDEKKKDEDKPEENEENPDNEDGDKKNDENPEDENSDDKKDNDKDDDDDVAEMKAVVITVKKGDEDKCKEELIEAGVSEEDIDILDAEEDDENIDIRIDVNSVMELKDYLANKGIDLEEKIGGEIVDDSEEDENPEDDKKDDKENQEGEEDFNFDDLGDIFGAEDAEE